MRTRLVFLMAAMAIIASGCFKVNFTIDVNDDGSGTVDGIVAQVNNPRHGVMPGWKDRLDAATLKQLAVYVHSLGGGE